MPVSRLPIERFAAKLLFMEDGCWLWAAKRTPNGYGQFWLGGHVGVLVYAHRWSYEFFVGPVTPGAEIDHLCRNRLCVNPAHLEAVTHVINVRRGMVGRYESSKTRCPQGHPYDARNTHRTPMGHRACRACARDREQAKRARQRIAV